MPMRSSPIRFIDFCRRICQSSSFIIFALPIQSIQSHLNHSPSPFFQAWDWHSITDFATQTDIFGLCAVAVCCGGVKSGFLLHSFIRLLDSCFACHITCFHANVVVTNPFRVFVIPSNKAPVSLFCSSNSVCPVTCLIQL